MRSEDDLQDLAPTFFIFGSGYVCSLGWLGLPRRTDRAQPKHPPSSVSHMLGLKLSLKGLTHLSLRLQSGSSLGTPAGGMSTC